MKARTLASAALTIAALFLLLWLLRPSARHVALPGAEEEALPSSAAAEELEDPTTLAPAPAMSSGRIAEEARAPLAPTAATAAGCIVLGRVIDEERRGLAQVVVRLFGYKLWAEGRDVPRLAGEYDHRGWEARTDGEGRFRFEVPVPTAMTTQLSITPDPFHDSARVYFGGRNAAARPPLRAGENDLGEFLLAATGAIRGSVSSQAGAPLAGAELQVGADASTTIGREAVSDANGIYQIDHVKPGSHGVGAGAEGWLSEFRKPIEVQAGRVSAGVDFRLKAAPILRGRVEDEHGRGLAGVRLWGWPISSGKGAGAKSAADGSFTIVLPQDEPYTLEAELVGHDSFGKDARSKPFAPGSEDLRIVLPHSRSARTLFRVVDGDTQRPVELFGLEIERDRGSDAGRSGWTNYRANPQPATHPGGELELDARPGLDLLTVCAPGYVRLQDDVRHAAEGEPEQTVSLVPGGTLSGRVVAVAGDGPVAGAAVRLQFGQVRKSKDSPVPTFQPDDMALQAVSDADGRFRFEMLEPGDSQLVARGPDDSVHERVLALPARGNLELGELVLVPGATILGQVVVPPGQASAGLEVYLDEWRHDVKRVTDAQGRFRFEALGAGPHRLLLAESPGRITSQSADLTLAAGETREVVLDARDAGLCALELTLVLGDAPAAALAVDLVVLGPPERRHELGLTDAAGRVSGWAPAWGRARVELRLAGGAALLHPDPIGPLELEREFVAALRFEIGSLALVLPPDLVLPPTCGGKLVLTRVGAERSLQLYLRPASANRSDLVRSDLVLADGALRCAHVPPGEYELELVLSDESVRPVRIAADGGYRLERPALYETRAHVRISAGTSTRVELR